MEIGSYITVLERALHLEPRQRSEITAEVRGHLEEHAAELETAGASQDAAIDQAIEEMGNPRQLAASCYSSYTTGSWRDSLLAASPHLLLAAIFAFHLWTRPVWMATALGVTTLIAVAAWRMGRPNWSYPWVGYALALPVLSWAMAVATVSYGIWALLARGQLSWALAFYLVIALWARLCLSIILRITRKAVSADWLVVSLAALPLPIIGSWLFLLHWRSGQVVTPAITGGQVDAQTALIFLALAATTAVYMRMGRRGWRIALLLVAAPALVAVATSIYMATQAALVRFNVTDTFHTFQALVPSSPGLLPSVLAFIATAAFLVSPMLLTRGRREDRRHQPPSLP